MTVLGWIDRSERRHSFEVHTFHKDFDIPIFLQKQDVTNNDCKMHTIVRVALRKAKGNTYEGRIVEVFPSLDDPELELAIIQEKHGFPMEFSEQALRDAKENIPTKPGKRIDLTHCMTVTIDGETAKDFDDAISVQKLSSGNFNLKVSIADVSFFVREGSALDREAYERGTSIYFTDRCVPMLPENLSNHLCSLVPHEPRFTLTCEMEISPTGTIVKSNTYPSIIKSCARLTYTQVARVLADQKTEIQSDIIEMLKTAHELSLILRKAKQKKGALDLDLPETEIEVNSTGDVVRIFLSERNEAHRLIEDFMVLANEAVSEKIEGCGYPSIYRVHEDPDPVKIERLEDLTRRWGFSLSKKGNLAEAMQKYLDSVRGHPNEKILIVSLLRSLKQARYSASNAGHFGLGSTSYCHFTSPIRRYPDLMIHRILRKSDFLKAKESAFSEKRLQEISERCSETERRAFLAERDMEDIKKTRYLESHIGEECDGLVISVKSFGLFIELIPHLVEGLVPLRNLPFDYWDTDEAETRLSGRKTGKVFSLGDKVRVRIDHVDRLKRQISLRLAGHDSTKERTKSERQPHGRHRKGRRHRR